MSWGKEVEAKAVSVPEDAKPCVERQKAGFLHQASGIIERWGQSKE